SQIGFTPVHLLAFQHILQFNVLLTSSLLVVFSLACVGIGLVAADRVFTYNIGARTEQITTIKKEKLIHRVLQRIIPGDFGTLVVTCFKDFFRKASNLSKIVYGISLAAILPFVMFSFSIGLGYELDLMTLLLIGGTGMAISGSFAFSGTAFMESEDQLWIIQSTPSGTQRFVKARLVTALIIALPLGIIPAFIMMILMGGSVGLFVFLFAYGYIITCGAILFSMGVTTFNPHYENMKSPQHQSNIIISTMGVQFILLAPISGLIFGDIFGLPFWGLLMTSMGVAGIPVVLSFMNMTSLLVIGSMTLIVGTHRLAQVAV
ncbi:MAG: hypothetical protein Q6361_07980, partial [Candidatus Hermodarchaeota archaeon]|nr:hypothetical protein [Candidatus Hermodarchaeota archaeon]